MIESLDTGELLAWLPRNATLDPSITAYYELEYYSSSYIYKVNNSIDCKLSMGSQDCDYIRKSIEEVVSSMALPGEEHIYALSINKWANNYYHWVAQAMAAWATLTEYSKRADTGKRLLLITPAVFKAFHFQWLNLLGGDTISLPRRYKVCLSHCLVASSSYENPSLSSVQRVRAAALASMNAWLRNAPNTIIAGLPTDLDRLYLSRGAGGARAIINEIEFEDHARRLGLTVIRAESLSVLQQIYIFSRASLIVGFHGAGLTNLIFANQDCHILELVIPKRFNECYKRLAALVPVGRYTRVSVQPCGSDQGNSSTLEIPIDYTVKQLQDALGVEV